ncbi:MAG: alanine:cation symporter family protein [Campylobacter sp.]|uniref:alanine:cation symporter family protein n=1 Tax=Campylobacter sp. TaxID=205 RepID=UPI002AA6C45B|nr:alanine:cation symporter family protein [Campylobacter sp.]MCI6178364.1 alanine:cation symporter family protein [Campylobacter sp.]
MGFTLVLRQVLYSSGFYKDAIFVLREKSQKEHISPFGALMVSTASRVGIGNIVGVAVAIARSRHGLSPKRSSLSSH